MNKFMQKQAPPGPSPRPGLVWKPSTHRWVRLENFSGHLEEEKHKLNNMWDEINKTRNLARVTGNHPTFVRRFNDAKMNYKFQKDKVYEMEYGYPHTIKKCLCNNSYMPIYNEFIKLYGSNTLSKK